jgi:hypothetical protein
MEIQQLLESMTITYNEMELVNLAQYYTRYNIGIMWMMMGDSRGDRYRRVSMTFCEDKGKR